METPVVNKINLNDKFCNNNFCYLKQRDNPNIIKKKFKLRRERPRKFEIKFYSQIQNEYN